MPPKRKPIHPPPSIVVRHWPRQLAFLLLSIVLLSLSYAPWGNWLLGWLWPGQIWGLFPLAWVALVPWLHFVRTAASHRRAFLFSWLAGTVFYFANMWWLGFVTWPGTAALLIYIAIYWGVAAVLLRTMGLLPGGGARPIVAVPAVAAVWVGLEWLRGYIFWGGLPFLYLSHSQAPVLGMCQIADITGDYGVSFWVMMLNALWAWIIAARSAPALAAGVRGAKVLTAVVLLGVMVYGLFRMSQAVTTAGPDILLIQPNFAQSNKGEKGATPKDMVEYHLIATRRALAEKGRVNLVVWSETVMPELNADFARLLLGSERVGLQRVGQFLQSVDRALASLVAEYQVHLLTGGTYARGLQRVNDNLFPANRRNSAYLYVPGAPSSVARYDKVHLVPFGEFMPFKQSFPPLYRLFNLFNPYGYDYTLEAGAPDALTVFEIHNPQGKPWRLVTPICFEDIDSRLVAAMFRPAAGQTTKRADILVNLTNDGWFRFNQNALHVQAALFRSIENRVPTARAVNTGISGFVESSGRLGALLAERTEGAVVTSVKMDRRVTFYTRWGDVFALLCLLWTLVGGAGAAYRWIARRRAADNVGELR